MTRPGLRRSPALFFVLLAASALVTGTASAQALDCPGLRAAIDAAGPSVDPAQADAAMQRQRDEILRARDTANRSGCGDGFFDDPDSPSCRALARRVEMLQVRLQRMQDQAARGSDAADDDRRRDLQARFDAQCAADGAAAPVATMPVDPDAPATAVPVDPDAPPGPAAQPKVSRVLCVRHCDGAYYPLAVDVASDRMPDMDRICQAQCPAAESSAYAGGDGDSDVSAATASDGSAYSALPTAFKYLKGPVQACSCRAPHQSWASALAGAEALLQPQKGDVTVTAELSASMARPVPVPQKAVPAVAKPAPAKKIRARTAPALTVPAPPPAQDLTREFRGSDPTL